MLGSPIAEKAGQALAKRLVELHLVDLVVLALPRGSVPVATEVARALHAPTAGCHQLAPELRTDDPSACPNSLGESSSPLVWIKTG